jgi:hypothetical protein
MSFLIDTDICSAYLKETPLTDQQRFLLGECIDAYLPVDEAGRTAFESLLATEKYRGVRAMNKTTFEKGIEKGVERGREMERREVIRERLLEKFGEVPTRVEEQLEKLSFLELLHLSKAIQQANTLADLGFPSDPTA